MPPDGAMDTVSSLSLDVGLLDGTYDAEVTIDTIDEDVGALLGVMEDSSSSLVGAMVAVADTSGSNSSVSVSVVSVVLLVEVVSVSVVLLSLLFDVTTRTSQM